MNRVKVRAHGKINLGLDVLRKREDGYHEVRMIMQSVGLYDNIDIIDNGPSGTGKPEIEIETNLRYLPNNENNLAYKAAMILMDEFHINNHIYIRIKKMIPVAAGMAGGSSDAAAVMRGINKIFNLRLSSVQLKKRGVTLGADIPYCIDGGTALSEGIGEILSPLSPIPDCIILLVKPPINVSTKFVYGNLKADELTYHPDIDGMIADINSGDLKSMAAKMGNVLETVTVNEYPVINQIKSKMIEMGALNSIMSGSGPTVFGIFDNRDSAKKAYNFFKGSDMGRQVYLTDGGNGDERY